MLIYGIHFALHCSYRAVTPTCVDMLQITPSRLKLILSYSENLNFFKNLKSIMVGGEIFSLSTLKILKKITTAQIYNMYGPTETAVWSLVSELTNKETINIGTPIDNTKVYIIEDELCISGDCLSKGYINNNDLTMQKFVPNPFIPGQLMYKTGDVAKWLPDGNIQFIGRIDRQIKLNGRRIELEEIEQRLNENVDIKNSVVVVKENIYGQYLCAFCELNREIELKRLRDYLSEFLPQYMIPTHFIKLDKIPLTLNGKIDINALNKYDVNLDYKKDLLCEQIHERTISGFKIMSILKDKFDIKISDDNIITNINLIDLGVNSITFIKIIVEIERKFGFQFDDKKLSLSEFTTVESLISYVESKQIK